MKLKKLYFILISLFWGMGQLNALNLDSLEKVIPQLPDDSTKVDQMTDLMYYFYREEIFKSKQYAEGVLSLSQRVGYDRGIGKGYFGLGLFHDRMLQKDSALFFYQKSLEFFYGDKAVRDKAIVNNALGIFFRNREEYEKAKWHYRSAALGFLQLEDWRATGDVYNNLGNIFSSKEEYDSSLVYLNKALFYYNQTPSSYFTIIVKCNLGGVYERKGDYIRALTLFEEALELSKKEKAPDERAAVFNFLGSVHIKLGKLEEANDYLMRSKKLSQDLNNLDRLDNVLVTLIELEKAKNNWQQAYHWSNELIVLRDSIYSLEKQSAIDEVSALFDLEKKDAEIHYLKTEKELNANIRFWLRISIGLLILAVVIVFLWLKTKVTQERSKKEQAERLKEVEVKNLKLEQEKIASDLSFKEKELTTFALQMVHKNELIDSIQKKLNNILNEPEDWKDDLKKLIVKLKQHQLIGNDLIPFDKHLQEISSSFFSQLEQRYPDLTNNEKRLAALLRIGLSSKEIAVLNNVSESAVKISRHRLRKKLNLDSTVNLNELFRSLE